MVGCAVLCGVVLRPVQTMELDVDPRGLSQVGLAVVCRLSLGLEVLVLAQRVRRGK